MKAESFLEVIKLTRETEKQAKHLPEPGVFSALLNVVDDASTFTKNPGHRRHRSAGELSAGWRTLVTVPDVCGIIVEQDES